MSVESQSDHHRLYSEEDAAKFLQSPLALIPHWVESQGLEAQKDDTGKIIGFTREALMKFAQKHSFKIMEELLN